MKEVITQLQETEKNARLKIAQAQQQAQDRNTEAEQEAATLKESLLKTAINDAKQIKIDTVEKAEAEKTKKLAQTEAKLNSLLKKEQDKIPAVARDILAKLFDI